MNDPQFEEELWEHTEAAKKLNAIYANRIYVQPLGEGMVRINFGETMDSEPSYHTALVVTPEQAIDFAHVIYRIGVTVRDNQARTYAEAEEARAAEELFAKFQADTKGHADG